MAVTIDLYDPFCSYASLRNQSSSSRGACSGLVHDRWNPGTSTEIAAALHHNHHLCLIWENYRVDLYYNTTVVALIKLHVASLRSILIHTVSSSTAKDALVENKGGVFCSLFFLCWCSLCLSYVCAYTLLFIRPVICQLSSSRKSSAVYSASLTLRSISSVYATYAATGASLRDMTVDCCSLLQHEYVINNILICYLLWILVQISFANILWILSLSLASRDTKCLKLIICPFTCWSTIFSWISARASTYCSKCRAGVAPLHLAWKQWTMCSMLTPSPQRRTGCRTLWTTSMNPWHAALISRTPAVVVRFDKTTPSLSYSEERPVWLCFLKRPKFPTWQLSQMIH